MQPAPSQVIKTLTETGSSIRSQPVSSVTAASVRADVVMAILTTLVSTNSTLVNVCKKKHAYSKDIYANKFTMHLRKTCMHSHAD